MLEDVTFLLYACHDGNGFLIQVMYDASGVRLQAGRQAEVDLL